tara:strand:+ start:754 stop:1419 length:666 start_codon:yes stop_codon:yes gene_type:complete
MKFQIAIDGPVASGKTAVGRGVSKTLKWNFLDTGIMYRAATRSILDSGISFEENSTIIETVKKTAIDIDNSPGFEKILINGKDKTSTLKTPEIDRAVSIISKIPEVRKELVRQQRDIANQGPIVMVGRDIGSVVLPEAELRIYLEASVEIRAQRRYQEQIASEGKLSLTDVKVDLEKRDFIDTQRQDSPLSKYDFYTIIDTTTMSLKDVVNEITSIYRSQI